MEDDHDMIRFTLRIPRKYRDLIMHQCEKSFLQTSMNNWILGLIIKALIK